MRTAAVTFYQFVMYAIIKRHQHSFKFDTCKLEQIKDNSLRNHVQIDIMNKNPPYKKIANQYISIVTNVVYSGRSNECLSTKFVKTFPPIFYE